jgi:hypothetical protein
MLQASMQSLSMLHRPPQCLPALIPRELQMLELWWD